MAQHVNSVKNTYGRVDGTCDKNSNPSHYKLRSRQPLGIIEETSFSNKEDSPSDPFDKLLKSPMRQPVKLKPLSHWAKKVADLENAKLQPRTKCKDLYELSSSDESPVHKKSRKKPRPRKKKENMDPISLLLKNSTSVRRDKSAVKIENEGKLIKERLLTKKTEREMDGSLFTFSRKPIFGLSSTPGLKSRSNLVKPSCFNFYSPINRDSLTPKAVKKMEIDASRILIGESPKQLHCHSPGIEPSRRLPFSVSNQAPNFSYVHKHAEHVRRSRSILHGSPGFVRDSSSPRPKTEYEEKTPLLDETSAEASPASVENCAEASAVSGGNSAEVSPASVPVSPELSLVAGGNSAEVSLEELPSILSPVLNMGSTQSSVSGENETVSMSEVDKNYGSGLPTPSSSLTEEEESISNFGHFSGFSSSDIKATEVYCPEGSKDSGHEMETLDETGFLGFSSLEGSRRDLLTTLQCPKDSFVDKGSRSHSDKTHPNVTVRRGHYNSDGFFKTSGDRSKICPNVTMRRPRLNLSKSGECNGKSFENSSSHSPLHCDRNVTIRRKRLNSSVLSTSSNILVEPSMAINCSEHVSLPLFDPTATSPPKSLKHDPNIVENLAKTNFSIISVEKATSERPKDVDLPEISPYFSACAPGYPTISETSSSSLIFSSSPELNKASTPPIVSPLFEESKTDRASETHSKQTSSGEEHNELGTLPCLNKSLLRLSCTVLKGGKAHKRARAVLRQLQSGRLTLHEESFLPQVPVGRGRKYETLVESVICMQPGIDKSILLNETAVSPLGAPKAPRRLTARTSIAARATLLWNTLTPEAQSKGNRTVRWKDSVDEDVTCGEDSSPCDTTLSKSYLRRANRMTRGDWSNKSSMAANVSVCVVPTADHRPTAFRLAYGIDDSFKNETDTSKNAANDEDCLEKTIQWTAKDVILARCNQEEPVAFRDHFNEKTLPNCKKIGEGVYGEVFMYDSDVYGRTVFKVIPIEGDMKVNDEPQKTFSEILSEIVITMELSELRSGVEQRCSGFVKLHAVWCVVGEYPELLQDLWNEFDVHKGSENDTPAMFCEDQLYIVLELSHGGQDLEAFTFTNTLQASAAFRQIAFSLAVAERALEFEHRDFHWGNVLVSHTTEKTVSCVLDGKEYKLPTEGVQVSIIDFTLSRMSFEGCAVFSDLSTDPGLFTSEGDYQYEIYRMMKRETNDDWEQFCPRTNIFWLHYTLDKMLSGVRYLRPKSKTHSLALSKLKVWRARTLNYKSSVDFAAVLI